MTDIVKVRYFWNNTLYPKVSKWHFYWDSSAPLKVVSIAEPACILLEKHWPIEQAVHKLKVIMPWVRGGLKPPSGPGDRTPPVPFEMSWNSKPI